MIDEEVSRSSIAITVRASKLTARGLAYVLGAAARQIRKAQREGNAPHGKQSARKLMRHGGDTSGMELPGDPRLFDRVARRWGVDYAIRPVEKGKYLLLFKAGRRHHGLLSGILPACAEPGQGSARPHPGTVQTCPGAGEATAPASTGTGKGGSG